MSCVETWMLNCEQVRDDISVRVQFGAWRELSGSGRGLGGKEGAGGCSGEVGCSEGRCTGESRAAAAAPRRNQFACRSLSSVVSRLGGGVKQ